MPNRFPPLFPPQAEPRTIALPNLPWFDQTLGLALLILLHLQ